MRERRGRYPNEALAAALLALLFPFAVAEARAQDIVVEGLVFDRSAILEAEGDDGPSPADVPMAGVDVIITGESAHGRGGQHPTGRSGADGRVSLVFPFEDDGHGHGPPKLRGAAVYEGSWYPFEVSDDGKFQVGVYQTTYETDKVRILKDSIYLEAKGEPPSSIQVRETLLIVNESTRAFGGVRPIAAMKKGLLATIRVPRQPHAARAFLPDVGMPLEATVIDQNRMAVMGTITPTGPEGMLVAIEYDLQVGEEGGGAISRPLYCPTETFQVYVGKSGIKVNLPDGFGEFGPADGELAGRFLLAEASGLGDGDEIDLQVSLRSNRFYWVLGLFAGAFLLALGLAGVASWRGSGSVTARAAAEPIARRIARLDIRNARGEIDPGQYAREREALIREAMAGREIQGADGAALPPEVMRLVEKIDALENDGADEKVKEGKRQAYLDELLEVIRHRLHPTHEGG